MKLYKLSNSLCFWWNRSYFNFKSVLCWDCSLLLSITWHVRVDDVRTSQERLWFVFAFLCDSMCCFTCLSLCDWIMSKTNNLWTCRVWIYSSSLSLVMILLEVGDRIGAESTQYDETESLAGSLLLFHLYCGGIDRTQFLWRWKRGRACASLIVCSILYWVRHIVAIFIIISFLSRYNFQCYPLSSPVCFILHRI